MKNRTASLRARLLNLAKKENIDFQLIIIRFLHERFLYRLSKSDFSEQFVLKGGSFIYSIQGIKTRPTVDIDLLGKEISNDTDTIGNIFRSICKIESDDEVYFRQDNIQAEVISKQDKYKGVRVFIEAEFDTIRQRLQIDVGFGDVITPCSQEIVYPVILEEMEVPILKAYSKETVIAEKFQAMIELSSVNSRMKDFYDVYMLLSTDDFDSQVLKEAIIATFENRNTHYIEDHALFTLEFMSNSQRQKNWNAFLRKINEEKFFTFETTLNLIINRLKPFWEKLQ